MRIDDVPDQPHDVGCLLQEDVVIATTRESSQSGFDAVEVRT
jgi:hypothetical protein